MGLLGGFDLSINPDDRQKRRYLVRELFDIYYDRMPLFQTIEIKKSKVEIRYDYIPIKRISPRISLSDGFTRVELHYEMSSGLLQIEFTRIFTGKGENETGSAFRSATEHEFLEIVRRIYTVEDLKSFFITEDHQKLLRQRTSL